MQADLIRTFVLHQYINPARERRERQVQIRAGDIHRAMSLINVMPTVCSALGSRKFQTMTGARLIGREGPRQGANARYLFDLDATFSDASDRTTPIAKAAP